jgi:hypothetical protein
MTASKSSDSRLCLAICVRERCKIVPVLNYTPSHEGVMESGGVVPPFFTSTIIMSGQLHSPAALSSKKEAAVTPYTGWVSPRRRSRRCGVQKNLLALQHVIGRYTDWSIILIVL